MNEQTSFNICLPSSVLFRQCLVMVDVTLVSGSNAFPANSWPIVIEQSLSNNTSYFREMSESLYVAEVFSNFS